MEKNISLMRLAVPLLLLFWSCKSEDTAPVVEVPPCQLIEQRATLTYASGSPIEPQTITTRLDFNNRNALATIFQTEDAGSYFDRADLKYNKKGQVTEIVHKRYRYVNEYNAQGKLAKQTSFAQRMGDAVEEQLGYYTLSYNNRQELAGAQQFSTASGKPVPVFTWRYTYANGDPVYLEQSAPGGESYYHVQLTYDTQHQPSLAYAHTYFDPFRPPSVHNLLRYTVQETNPGYASHNTSYTYNDAGYPISATTRYTDGREQTVTYTYVCK